MPQITFMWVHYNLVHSVTTYCCSVLLSCVSIVPNRRHHFIHHIWLWFSNLPKYLQVFVSTMNFLLLIFAFVYPLLITNYFIIIIAYASSIVCCLISIGRRYRTHYLTWNSLPFIYMVKMASVCCVWCSSFYIEYFGHLALSCLQRKSNITIILAK